MSRVAGAAASLAACGALLAAGCGGGEKRSAAPATTASAAAQPPAATPPAATAPAVPPTDAEVRAELRLPARVPLRATGSAPRGQVRVVRTWLDDLRAGRVREAARLFAIPARFQNLATLAVIATPAEALAVTRSLPCGARMTTAGGARGFVVYEAELTERPGGACGQGVGGMVRGAVLVRDGRIIEWYRLPDVAPAPGGQDEGGIAA